MVEIQSNQHLFCCGRTRSGKSILTKSFIPSLPRIIFHDRKMEHGSLVINHQFLRAVNPDQVVQLLQRGVKRILYQPIDPDNEDMNVLSKIIFDIGNITLIVDEASALFELNSMPFWSKELYRLGAQRGIGVWALSQRPKYINNVCLSEATFIISFKMNLDTDRNKIVGVCGNEVDEPLRTLPPYHFLFYDGIDDKIHWCAPIKVA